MEFGIVEPGELCDVEFVEPGRNSYSKYEQRITRARFDAGRAMVRELAHKLSMVEDPEDVDILTLLSELAAIYAALQ